MVKETETALDEKGQEICNKIFVSYMETPMAKNELLSEKDLKIGKIFLLFFCPFFIHKIFVLFKVCLQCMKRFLFQNDGSP